jgi:hypothetical protein
MTPLMHGSLNRKGKNHMKMGSHVWETQQARVELQEKELVGIIELI